MYKYLDFNKWASPLDFLSEDPKRMMENVGVTAAYLGGAGAGTMAGAMAGERAGDWAIRAAEAGLNRRLDTAAENVVRTTLGPNWGTSFRNIFRNFSGEVGYPSFRDIAHSLPVAEVGRDPGVLSWYDIHGTPAERSAARKLFNVADARLARMEAVDPKTVMRAGGVGGGILGALALGEFVRRKVRDRRAAVAEGPQQV